MVEREKRTADENQVLDRDFFLKRLNDESFEIRGQAIYELSRTGIRTEFLDSQFLYKARELMMFDQDEYIAARAAIFLAKNKDTSDSNRRNLIEDYLEEYQNRLFSVFDDEALFEHIPELRHFFK